MSERETELERQLDGLAMLVTALREAHALEIAYLRSEIQRLQEIIAAPAIDGRKV